MSECPVVRIKPSHPSQGDFVEINESDFDPKRHELYVSGPPEPTLPPPPPAAPAAAPAPARDTLKLKAK